MFYFHHCFRDKPTDVTGQTGTFQKPRFKKRDNTDWSFEQFFNFDSWETEC